MAFARLAQPFTAVGGGADGVALELEVVLQPGAQVRFVFDDENLNVDSMVYEWNGEEFVEFQRIPTFGARV